MTAAAFAVAANLAVYVLPGFVHARALRNPKAPWVQWLYVRQFGPRTDTRKSTPRELLRSSLVFLVWFAAFFGVLACNAFAGPAPREASGLRMAFDFATALLTLLWPGGAVWMFVLGLASLLRRRWSRRGGGRPLARPRAD